jgi:hypothetical protein
MRADLQRHDRRIYDPEVGGSVDEQGGVYDASRVPRKHRAGSERAEEGQDTSGSAKSTGRGDRMQGRGKGSSLILGSGRTVFQRSRVSQNMTKRSDGTRRKDECSRLEPFDKLITRLSSCSSGLSYHELRVRASAGEFPSPEFSGECDLD